MRSIIFNRFVFFCLMLLAANAAFSQYPTQGVQKDGGITEIISAVMNGSVSGPGNIPWQENLKVPVQPVRQTEVSRKFKNIISFYVKEEYNAAVLNDFTVTLPVKLYMKENPSATVQEKEIQLSLDYKKGRNELSVVRDYFYEENAEIMEFEVLDMNFPSQPGVNFEDVLAVENVVVVTRYFELQNLAPSLNTPAAILPGADQALITWDIPAGMGNNGIQLEWAWLEEELEDVYKISGNFTSQSKINFLNAGATRVDLDFLTTSYEIPLFYDGTGKLYFRVRGTSITENGSRIDGPWSAVGELGFSGHEPDLNWQVRTSFAEEGKRKSVVEYYDGLLRSRQTVTKDNDQNKVLVSETLYDYEGRPAVSILPAPLENTAIAYNKNLHLFNSPDPGISQQLMNENHADFFDFHFSQPVLSGLQLTGASKYYSPLSEAGHDFLPDAEGYPYAVTRYTKDGTGRIASQSGVGKTFAMGNGKETRYFYGIPLQEEIDGLFGTEVGHYSHYSKNMVIDPNGQASVSYVDMHGRTIATALAGDAPENLIALDIANPSLYPNQAGGTTLTVDLLSGQNNVVVNNRIESVQTLLVPVNTTYNFTYEFEPESLMLPTCSTGTDICYEAVYDLEFTIVDESGISEEAVFYKKYSNFHDAHEFSCSTATRLFYDVEDVSKTPVTIINFSKILPVGSYVVRKTLTINEDAYNRLKNDYLEKGLCNLDFDHIVDSVFATMKLISDCDVPVADPVAESCDDCLLELGTLNSFRTAYLNSLNLNPLETHSTSLEDEISFHYSESKAKCDLICGVVNIGTLNIRKLMLNDMRPVTGQYAKIGTYSGIEADYNIFSESSNPNAPFFRNPDNGMEEFYFDPQGGIDEAIHGDAGLLEEITPEDFARLYKNSWAESLLKYHPEYQRLKFLEEDLQAVIAWEDDFMDKASYSQASSAGYIFFTSANLTDPLFALPNASALKTKMFNRLKTNYIGNMSIWQYAYFLTVCKEDPLTAPCNDGPNLVKTQNPPFGLTGSQRDLLWNNFKSLYLSSRRELLFEFIATQKPLPSNHENLLVQGGFLLHFPKSFSQMAEQFDKHSEEEGKWNFIPDGNGHLNSGFLNDMQDKMNNRGNEVCSSYITLWENWLLQCEELANHSNAAVIIDTIIARMLRVCEKGTDELNPYGASTVPPSLPIDGSPRSFEEIILAVFQENGIDPSNFCNPYVIEYPKPYAKGETYAPAYITTLEDCNCDLFDDIKTAAIAAGKNPAILSQLNQYLKDQNLDTISPVLYSSLQDCYKIGTTVIQNCTPVYKNVSAPCNETNPCGVANLTSEPEPGTYMLTIDENGKPAYMMVPMAPPSCDPGYHWDEGLQMCVLDEGIPCLEGWEWDPILMDCVPSSCPPGYIRDRFGNCVLDYCNFECLDYYVCDTININNILLPQPVELPAFLTCGYEPVQNCLDCTDMKNLLTAFKDSFNIITQFPYADSLDLSASQADSLANFARFVNFRTGFNYNWTEYFYALDTAACNLLTGGSGNVLCRRENPLKDTSLLVVMDPCQNTYDKALQVATMIYNFRKETLLADFENQYRTLALSAGSSESFKLNYTPKEYHYTLYYYDQAGNLVKTVPPAGVKPDYSSAFLNEVKLKRADGYEQEKLPEHTKSTQYRYNSLNQVVEQYSPDGGRSLFWYDKAGRLAVSSNAEQRKTNRYSYTLYDHLGRITQVGQLVQSTAMTQAISQDAEALETWLSQPKEQLTVTVYDVSDPTKQSEFPAGFQQHNLRSRVSYSYVKATGSGPITHATFYTYDIHGNVHTLLQDYTKIAADFNVERFKQISYEYDLISGKVNKVAYQPGKTDAFYHRYHYDAENRITQVYTSRNGIYWERDAAYSYYRHGPLMRTVLGQQNVQGIDYAYTLQGWLKGVNSTTLDPVFDMGEDGKTGSPVARDVYSFGLHYYDNGTADYDYKNVGSVNPFIRPKQPGYKSLFNGNIGAMSVNLGALKQAEGLGGYNDALLYSYRYDQLNRIKSMNAFSGLNITGNHWNSPVATNDYKEEISYDPNGNILTYLRNGITATNLAMDNMTYHYNAGNNQLNHVTDLVSAGNYSVDIDNQSNNNYEYDAIGNLIKDNAEGISAINWNVYGKISSITKTSGTINYTYDATGNRISKTVGGVTTLYVRDASGNVMSVYEIPAANTLVQKELHIYGSSRLGMVTGELDIEEVSLSPEFGEGKIISFTRGKKLYELTNHLGNVLAVISDKKLSVAGGVYEADIGSATDYAPFGMGLVGRNYSSEGYRYGFNGKENDNETKTQDYGFRIYNPGLGKFLSVDPITASYPMLTPYQFASNRPIDGIDLDGLEYVRRVHIQSGTGQVIHTEDFIFYQMNDEQVKAHGGTTKGRYNAGSHGKQGEGVQHIYMNASGNVISERWDLPRTGAIASASTHGLYSGGGSITDASGEYDFSFQPIDIADAIAKAHDMDYALAYRSTKAPSQGYVEDVRTLQADLDMLRRLDMVSINEGVTAEDLGVETPFRTDIAGETRAAFAGQKTFIGMLAEYKTWKIGQPNQGDGISILNEENANAFIEGAGNWGARQYRKFVTVPALQAAERQQREE